MGLDVPFESLFSKEHKVTSPRQALSIVESAIRRRSMVTMILESSRSFNTLILEADERSLVLDELVPRDITKAHDLNGALCIFRHEGMFAGFVIESAARKPDETLSCDFPRDLHLLQRRMYYRVEVSSTDLSNVYLVRKGAAPCQGVCLDLSAGGMRLALHKPPLVPLTSMEELEHIEFSIGDSLHCVSARVRSVIPADSKTPMRVGLSFEGLPLPVERDIALYVQRRDRELLRIRAN